MGFFPGPLLDFLTLLVAGSVVNGGLVCPCDLLSSDLTLLLSYFLTLVVLFMLYTPTQAPNSPSGDSAHLSIPHAPPDALPQRLHPSVNLSRAFAGAQLRAR